jgi:hypothetical protein
MTIRTSLIAAFLLLSATAAQATGSEQKAASSCAQACSCGHDKHAAAPAAMGSAAHNPTGMTPEELEYMRNSP